ncbi:MAG TPA: hypothetical protein VJV23_07880 [Candidatus Polarisedimenticolia bacterium]|nr:hypothetical protein [Candidatus Polarisedimenticolia bacterium]
MTQDTRQLRIKGHEIVSHTATARDGRYRCLVFLMDPFDDRHDVRVFRGTGALPAAAEGEAIGRALEFLDLPAGAPVHAADRVCLNMAGRRVDIFCDLVGERRYQAFPFLRRQDGTYGLIMRFHLNEAVTGRSPAQAMARCIRRLEEYFAGPGRDDR